MPSKIGSIFVKLGLDTATFHKKVRTATSRLSRSVKKMRASLAKLSKPISVVTGALGLLGGISFGAMIRSSLNSVDALAKQADRLAISTEALRGYQLAANLAGASNSDLEKGIQKLNKNIGDVASGLATQSSAVSLAFKQIGLDANLLKNQSPEQAFELVTQRLSEIPDVATRTSAAMAILGKSGANLGNLLLGGAEGLRQAKEEALALGASLNRVDAAKIEIANDATTRLKTAFEGFSNQLTVQLAPLLAALADGITNLAVRSGGFGNIIEKSLSIGVSGFGFMADAVLGLRIAFLAVRGGLYKVIQVLLELQSKFSKFQTGALSSIADIIGGFRQMASSIATSFEQVIKTVTNTIIGLVNTVLKKVKEAVEGSINFLIDGINKVAQYLPGGGIERLSLKGIELSSVDFKLPGKEIADGVLSKAEGLVRSLARTTQIASDISKSGADIAGEIAKDDFDKISELASGAIPSEAIKRRFEEIKGKYQNMAEEIAAKAPAQAASIEKIAQAAGGAASKVGSIGASLKDVGSNAAEQASVMQQAFQSSTRKIGSAFDDFVENGKISFKGLMASISKDFTKLAIKNAASNLFGNGKGGFSFGSIINGVGKVFGGFRADGGPVSNSKSYLVGERGPELFTPSRSGAIIPNEQLRGNKGGSGKTVVFNEHINIQPGVSRDELRVTLEELERVRDEKQRRMIDTGEGVFAGLVEA